MDQIQFLRRVSECELFYDFQNNPDDATYEDYYQDFNVSHLSTICKIDGKRIVINPDKRPYNISEVTLWSLDDDGNAVSHLEMDTTNEECYYFERLERVLATQVMAKQRWKAVKMKQKFDRQRFKTLLEVIPIRISSYQKVEVRKKYMFRKKVPILVSLLLFYRHIKITGF